MLDAATRINIDNIDWIIDNEPMVERTEWMRRATEVLEHIKYVLTVNAKRREQLETANVVVLHVLEALIEMAARNAAHRPGCERDTLDWSRDANYGCPSCELLALARYVLAEEAFPEHYGWMVRDLAQEAMAIQ